MSNNFQPFDPNKVGLMSDVDYAASDYRKDGVRPGIAPGDLHNKLYYQLALMTWALADIQSDRGYTVSDSDAAALKIVMANLLDASSAKMNGLFSLKKGTDIASATTTDLSTATGNVVDITGTTTIDALGTVDSGTVFMLRFVSGLTLTYNVTSMILPGAVNLSVLAGDVCEFISLGGGNWKLSNYQPATTHNAHAQKIINLASGTASGEAIHFGQFPQSLGDSGYITLPTGLIIQWGTSTSTITANTGVYVTFSLAFPSSALNIVAVARNGAAVGAGITAVTAVSKSQFLFYNNSSVSVQGYWFIAIGY